MGRVYEQLAQARARIAEVARKDPELSATQLAARFGVSSTQVARALAEAGLKAGSAHDHLSLPYLNADANGRGEFVPTAEPPPRRRRQTKTRATGTAARKRGAT